jgi:membrane protein YqaA with SNARE-associated domain
MEPGIIIGAALTVSLGGILPWINSELVILASAALLPPVTLPILVVACAAAQIASKSVVYGITRWAPHRLPERAQAVLARAEKYRDRRRLLTGAVFVGAAVSVPPFYLVTLASGLLRVPFVLFVLAGLSGTLARYSFIVWAACALGAGSCQ